MPLLINKESGLSENLSQELADQALKNQTHEIPLYDPEGNLGSASLEDAKQLLSSGYSQPNDKQLQTLSDEGEFKSTPERLKAAAEAVAHGALPLGASTAIERAFGAEPERIRKREEYSLSGPERFAAETAGLIGSSFIPGVGQAGILEKAGAGLGERAALAITKGVAETPEIAQLGKIAGFVGRGAGEFATMAAGDEISKMIAENPDATMEHAIANVGLSAALGAVGGGVLGYGMNKVPELWKATKESKAAKFAGDFVDQFKGRFTNANLEQSLKDSLQKAHDSISDISQKLYEEGGLKDQDIKKLLTADPKYATEQVQTIYNGVLSTLEKLKKAKAPDNIINKYEEAMERFEENLAKAKAVIPEGAIPQVAQKEVLATPIRVDEHPLRDLFPWLSKRDLPAQIIRGEAQPIQREMLNAEFTHPGDSFDIYNSVNGLKRDLQRIAAPYYEKGTAFKSFPTGAEVDAMQTVAERNAEIRKALEDTQIWGKAGERQAAINKAYSELQGKNGPLKQFRQVFMNNINDEWKINPDKVTRYIEAINKGKKALDQDKLENFIKGHHAFHDVIAETSHNLGIENPVSRESLQAAEQTIANQSPAQIAANSLYDKGVGQAVGSGTGALVGGALGHPFIGAMFGNHFLGPIFDSLLPGIVKSMIDKPASGAGTKAALEAGYNAARGVQKINKAIGDLFKIGAQKSAPVAGAMISDALASKLDKRLKELQASPQDMIEHEADLAHYMPNHQAAAMSVINRATGLLNQQRPQNQPQGPLDLQQPLTQAQKDAHKQNLSIAEDPMIAFEKIKNGTLTAANVQTLQGIYPTLYKQAVDQIWKGIIDNKHELAKMPYAQKLGMSVFIGSPLDSTMMPMGIMSAQSVLGSKRQGPLMGPPAKGPGSRGGTSHMNALNKMPGMSMTPLQARSAAKSSR